MKPVATTDLCLCSYFYDVFYLFKIPLLTVTIQENLLHSGIFPNALYEKSGILNSRNCIGSWL